MKPMKVLLSVWAIVLVAGLGIATAEKASVPHAVLPQEKVDVRLDQVKQLLLLMDTDKEGKISKQEFIRFMETQFDRLDKNRSGELNKTELKQSQSIANHPRYAGK